jgi:DNA-binding transcriptional MerR regulator
MAELPSKLFFRIGEVAGLVGVEPHVLRYWEREFRSIRPTKSAKGQRVYSRKDVENLLRVRDLLYRDGFTIAGAKKKLQRGGVEPGHDPALEAASAAAPSSEDAPPATSTAAAAAAPGSALDPRVRAKLMALRDEIEQFLDELGGS